LGKSKEAALQLEKAIKLNPRMVKKFVELDPSLLQNQLIVDIIAKNKKKG
jgi:hypothetical protein